MGAQFLWVKKSFSIWGASFFLYHIHSILVPLNIQDRQYQPMSQEDFFSKKRKTKRRFYSQRVITGLGGTSKERLKPLTHNCSIKNGETVYPGTVTGLDSHSGSPHLQAFLGLALRPRQTAVRGDCLQEQCDVRGQGGPCHSQGQI